VLTAIPLRWTRKPFSDWWSHPIFAPGGFWTFWLEWMADFWRGEFVWSGRRLASPAAAVFYWSSSTVLPGRSGISALRHFKNNAMMERALRFSLGCVLAAIAFLGLLSVSFDFGKCLYPSPAYPYFTSGRLINGALIPFVLLYARGLDLLFNRVKSPWPKFLALVVIVLGVTISEIIVNAPGLPANITGFICKKRLPLDRGILGFGIKRGYGKQHLPHSARTHRERPPPGAREKGFIGQGSGAAFGAGNAPIKRELSHR
jgi:hypothetical protein